MPTEFGIRGELGVRKLVKRWELKRRRMVRGKLEKKEPSNRVVRLFEGREGSRSSLKEVRVFDR